MIVRHHSIVSCMRLDSDMLRRGFNLKRSDKMPLREVEFPSDPKELAHAKEQFLVFYSSRTNGQLWCPVSTSLSASHKASDLLWSTRIA